MFTDNFFWVNSSNQIAINLAKGFFYLNAI